MTTEDLRFDVYVVIVKDDEYQVTKLSQDLPLLVAEILAGVTNHDFIESVASEGWVGSCPQWRRFLPVVTVPHGGRLSLDHFSFMMESLQ